MPSSSPSSPASPSFSPSNSVPIPILLLKSPSTPTDAYHTLLSATSISNPPSCSSRTFSPHFLPVLTTTFSTPALASLTSQLSFPSSFISSYGGIIFTSQRAVQALGEVFDGLKEKKRNTTTAAAAQANHATTLNSPSSLPTSSLSSISASDRATTREEEQLSIPERWAAHFSSSSTLPSTISSLLDSSPPCLTFFVVGHTTASSLRSILSAFLPPTIDLSQVPIYGEDSGSGSELAKVILQIYNNAYRNDAEDLLDIDIEVERSNGDGRRGGDMDTDTKQETVRNGKRTRKLLFLVGEKRRDVIPRMLQDPELKEEERVEVEEKVVYETQEREELADELAVLLVETAQRMTREAKPEGQVDAQSQAQVVQAKDKLNERWIVIFSPQGCAVLLKCLGWLDEETERAKNGWKTGEEREKRSRELSGDRVFDRVMAIGPTTKIFLREEFGVEVDAVAEEPSAKGVRGALLEFYGGG